MNRFAVILLAAFDGVLAVAGSLALVLAPLVLFWAFGVSFSGDWSQFWPTAVALWQLIVLVPLRLNVDADYAFGLGFDQLDPFIISLAPLLLTITVLVFAFRSGARAASASHSFTGVIAATISFAAVAFGLLLSGGDATAVLQAAEPWQAVLLPSIMFLLPAIFGAAITAWRLGRVSPGARPQKAAPRYEPGPIFARVRDYLASLDGSWQLLPNAIARLIAAILMGLLAVSGVSFALSIAVNSAEMITLYQSGGYDLLGVIIVSFAQLLYLPNFIVYALSYLSGAGFSLGATIAPGGNTEGLIPPFPIFAAAPQLDSHWALLLVLIPITVAAVVAFIERARMLRRVRKFSPSTVELNLKLRLSLVFGAGVAVAVAGFLAALIASGAIGPGTLSHIGPQPWLFALLLGAEVAVGVAIGMFAPLRPLQPEKSHETVASGVAAVPDAGGSVRASGAKLFSRRSKGSESVAGTVADFADGEALIVESLSAEDEAAAGALDANFSFDYRADDDESVERNSEPFSDLTEPEPEPEPQREDRKVQHNESAAESAAAVRRVAEAYEFTAEDTVANPFNAVFDNSDEYADESAAKTAGNAQSSDDGLGAAESLSAANTEEIPVIENP